MIIKSYNPVTVIRTTLLHDVLMYASRETKITERHYALNMPSESSLNYALCHYGSATTVGQSTLLQCRG